MSEKEETTLEATEEVKEEKVKPEVKEEVEEKPEEEAILRGTVCTKTEETVRCTPIEAKYVKGELSSLSFYFGEAEEEKKEEKPETQTE